MYIIIGFLLLVRNLVKYEYNVILLFEYLLEMFIVFGIFGGLLYVFFENEMFWYIFLLVFFEKNFCYEYIFFKIWLWKKFCMKLLIIVIIILSVFFFRYLWCFIWILNVWCVLNCFIIMNGIIFCCFCVFRKILVSSCVVVYYVICV